MAVSVLVEAAEARRLALVVGNADYDTVYSLKNAKSDATDVAAALERLNFEVTLLTDIDGADFWKQLEAFATDAETADSTLFYFSGHAFQLDGANYLVPSDARLTSRAAIPDQTWRLDTIIKKLQSRDRQTLIFLDACRNNPLPVSQHGASGQGLAKVETGSGTFVAFATQPNNTTSDGVGDNSPFTTALLSSMESKGISISDMMIDVRNSVEEATFGKQTPWDQSSLRAQFYFNPEVERIAQLTQADYEMIARLDPDTRNRLLSTLTRAGLQIEEAEIADQIQAREAAVNPGLIIEDVPDIGGTAALPRTVPVGQPDDAPVAVASQPGFIIEDVPVGGGPFTSTASDRDGTVAMARPVSRVRQPRESNSALVPPSRLPGDTDRTPVLMERPEDGPKARLDTPSAAGEVIQTTPINQQSRAVTNPRAPAARAFAATARPAVDRDLPAYSTDGMVILASISADNILEPAFTARPRLPGEDLTPEEAAQLGIVLPDGPELVGRDLSRAVQQQLARLGCYRMRVDGQFGKGSKLALLRYYGNKGIAPEELDATNSLLSVLKAERQVICKGATIQNQRVAKAKRTITSKRKPVAQPAAAKRVTAPKITNTRKITTTRTVTTSTGQSTEKKITRMNTGVFR
ncbi:caspase family protein [Actibacterium sp. 188UL27-1]|uniref:caspase family protein n=1 Tax=Actibacterium sp. 188UL27-1 TaxID=2786961 RepID=UPI00195B93CF|nr:caspase family protein [Actibacterium sp. 188UL27-1]MBM7068849.1 caspase family protein [Actibacterium sp. 188UL27-1]